MSVSPVDRALALFGIPRTPENRALWVGGGVPADRWTETPVDLWAEPVEDDDAPPAPPA